MPLPGIHLSAKPKNRLVGGVPALHDPVEGLREFVRAVREQQSLFGASVVLIEDKA